MSGSYTKTFTSHRGDCSSASTQATQVYNKIAVFEN